MASGACESYVLVVDDYVDACQVLRRLITHIGFDADCVHSGEAALAALRTGRRRCCLMLLDLMMPGMNGFDVLEALRADAFFPAVLVVICSAAERDTHWPEARALGAKTFWLRRTRLSSAVWRGWSGRTAGSPGPTDMVKQTRPTC